MEKKYDDIESLKNKVVALEKEMDRLNKLLTEKDVQLTASWELIQRLRLVNRIKAPFHLFSKFSKVLRSLGRSCILIFQSKRLEQRQLKTAEVLLPYEPTVSIVIVNRNGKDHLGRLLPSIFRNTGYKNYEIIIADNCSTDGSVEFVRSFNHPQIKIIKNDKNLSFSKANNVAVAQARGELLLFLNNDTIALKGWLYHLLNVYFQNDPAKVGVVGSVLLYPGDPEKGAHLLVQHAGINFRDEGNFIRPVNIDSGAKYYERHYQPIEERTALTAACLLVSKFRFLEVGGFDESYVYGYEDVDFCLKLIQAGYKNYLAGNSVLFHDESATQHTLETEEIENRRRCNARVFSGQWFEFLRNRLTAERAGDSA